MKKILYLFFMFQICLIYSTTITADQEGNGEYLTIMEAINVTVNFDTVLVYPGEYHEEVNYLGKTIVIGSLNLTTGNEEYIHSTIINGDDERRGVTVEEYNGNTTGEGTKIVGFTITYCRDNYGGGIFVEDSYLSVENCIVCNNYSRYYGGGIYTDNSYVDIIESYVENNYAVKNGGGILAASVTIMLLSETTIRYNQADRKVGGIITSWDAEVEFDSENLCNMYGNYGPQTCDLDIMCDPENPTYFSVYLDTFSCIEPDRYFIAHGNNGNNFNWEYLNLNVNTAYYDFYYGDLYVSPDGNDENSGISPTESMQTIAGAITKIVSNPLNPNTVYMAAGTYSPELNNQLFPLNMKGFVSIIGEDMETVIWDGDGFGYIKDYYSEMEYEIKNITLIDGPLEDSQMLFWRENTERRNVYIQNLHSIDQYVGLFDFVSSVEFEVDNVIIEGLHNNWGVYASDPGNHSIVRNTILKNCYGDIQHGELDGTGGNSNLDLINCLLVDNYKETSDRYTYAMNIYTMGYTAATNVINCTIMNNEFVSQNIEISSLKCVFGADYNIYNTMIYGNTGYILDIGTDGVPEPSEINISHSLLEGGEDNIYVEDPNAPFTLNWLEGNLDCDPMVCEDYTPQAGSPLIDAGTLELPYDIELPEFDVLGNPRIYGNGVDIGAIEWQGTGNSNDEIAVKPNGLMIYPNPLIAGNLRDGKAKMVWMGDNSDDISVEIFNIKGQRLRELKIDQSSSDYDSTRNEKLEMNTTTWDLRDDAGEIVSSGVYFVRVKTGDDYQTQQKVTVVK